MLYPIQETMSLGYQSFDWVILSIVTYDIGAIRSVIDNNDYN